MNWGNKLILVFIVFAGLILTLVYKASTAKFDLVSKEYYKEELRYQDKIDGMHNANKLSKVIVAPGCRFGNHSVAQRNERGKKSPAKHGFIAEPMQKKTKNNITS